MGWLPDERCNPRAFDLRGCRPRSTGVEAGVEQQCRDIYGPDCGSVGLYHIEVPITPRLNILPKMSTLWVEVDIAECRLSARSGHPLALPRAVSALDPLSSSPRLFRYPVDHR